MTLLVPSEDVRTHRIAGDLVRYGEDWFYRIRNSDAMSPFLMTVASSSDHWLFASSNGALTAGRRTPDLALFPYYTEDRIHDSQDQTGGKTLLRVRPGTTAWEPFSDRDTDRRHRERSLLKSVAGTRVIFSETDHDLGLTFTQEWTTSARYGFVRRCTLINVSGDPVEVDVLDGVQNLLPAGVEELGQLRFSALVDGLKDNELDPETGLGIFRLSALRSDSAEPSESLRVTTVWSSGLGPGAHLLSTEQIAGFRAGGTPRTESRMRGRRGAYLVTGRCVLPPGGEHGWVVVAEVGSDAAAVVALRKALRAGAGADLVADVDADVRRGGRRLEAIVAAADGIQRTDDPLENGRHFANTLFNVLRGGVPDDGYRIRRDALLSYLAVASTDARRRHDGLLSALPDTAGRQELIAAVAPGGPELERLVREYLPLRYSRRHGDPSRPWNTFTINTEIGYEGNWRDIFQNWEALAYSFPGYLDAMILKFVNSSTADGHNPFHITDDGYDWERLAPGQSPLHLGYWGDHQVIYLLKLLEAADRFDPGMMSAMLHRRMCVYADVPYRIKPYAALLDDPHFSIDFDADHDAELIRRRAAHGAAGTLLPDPDGVPLRVSLAEKLLVVALAKLTNFVPGLGIWMNTQRPEWNDGNNALVGYGVSVVTLCHLRRYLVHCRELFASSSASSSPAADVSTEVAAWFRAIVVALARFRDVPVTDTVRRDVLDALGGAGSDYRTALYAHGLSGERTAIPADDLRDFCDVAVHHLDRTIRANRRSDGMYHAYNLLRVAGDAILGRRLDLMLEGQVAALSSGLLDAAECADVLDALRASALYRADQRSYLLYPDRELPSFLDKGVLPADAEQRCTVLRDMIHGGDERIVVRDVDGAVRFHADFRNDRVLAAALQAASVDPEQSATILAMYEEVFDHQSFTGRSGTLFKYEGLGCIYWHMVSKLRLAVHEVLVRHGGQPDVVPAVPARLRDHYEHIRAGIGVHKSPALYGAVPMDPHSHTPGFGGAQQPGMTGQVKEDLLARLGELGVVVSGGRLTVRPDLIRRSELLDTPGDLHCIDVHGRPQVVELPSGALGLTLAQVPIVIRVGDGLPRIVVWSSAGEPHTIKGLALDRATSGQIFNRTGEVIRLEIHVGPVVGEAAR